MTSSSSSPKKARRKASPTAETPADERGNRPGKANGTPSGSEAGSGGAPEATKGPISLEDLRRVLPEALLMVAASKGRASGVTVAEPPPDVQGEARVLWLKDDPADTSKHDFLFVLAMLRTGVPKERIREVLPCLPAGKMCRDNRGEDYWLATIKSVEKVWKEDEAALRRVKKLKSKDAFLPENVTALARVFILDRRVYEKALRKMKKRLRIPKLEAEVKKELGKLQAPDLEPLARCVVDGKKVVGWWARLEDEWTAMKFNEFRAKLDGMGLASASVCSSLADKPWKLVNVPFGPEEPEPRKWNKDAARLKHVPAAGPHPTWDKILAHAGRSLDAVVATNEWCAANGVKTGGEYLLRWVASVFQRPLTPLPYLFFHGDQLSGKSTFHEVLSCLMDPGYVVANEALENKSGFNGEIAGAIVCAADEIELTRRSYKRIKQWSTGRWILIHPKGAAAYQLRNATHWIQTGNSINDIPLLRGDTRITVISVSRPDEGPMSKDVMEKRCAEEAPAFLHTVLGLELPAMVGRLGVPVLETHDKKEQQEANRNELEEWLDATPDALAMEDEELAQNFLQTLGGKVAHEWDRGRVFRELPYVMRARRRVVLGLLDLVKEGPWKGTTQGLWETLPGAITSGVSGPVALGQILASPLPRLAVGKRHTRKGAELLISKNP